MKIKGIIATAGTCVKNIFTGCETRRPVADLAKGGAPRMRRVSH